MSRSARTARPPLRLAGFARVGRRVLAAVVAALLVLLLPAPPAHADLKGLENEFKEAIERVETVTVVVVPRDVPGGAGISGVIVSRKGVVLTHSEAGRIDERVRGKPPTTRYSDDVDVRVPDLKKGTFTNYRGRVTRRAPDLQSAVIELEKPPSMGFSTYLAPGTSAEVRVGTLAFAMGNSFGMGDESAPALTAGVVAAVVRPKGTSDRGAIETIYTTAAVNPGVSGGPVVDVHGRLIGTVMGWVDAQTEPDSPFQFLGRVVPVDRLRAFWSGANVPAARDAFEATPPRALNTPEADALETVLARTSAAAMPGLASITVQRKAPVSSTTLGPDGKPVDLPRYRGPVSAFVVSADGLVATSLYNVTNLATLSNPNYAGVLPPEATTKAGIDAVEGASVTFTDGTTAPAKLVSIHEGIGVALFRAELPVGRALTALSPAPADAFVEGRFVLALGDPYGAERPLEPFLTFGILSKHHADDAASAWRGHWQTDARGTDGNCGGAVVDLRGRLLGMMTLWDPVHHQRASGIAFVLPWEKLAAALPEMSAGRSFRRPLLGIWWDQAPNVGARIDKVNDGSAAAAAGLRPGDAIVEVDGNPVASPADFAAAVSGKWAGDSVKLKIQRGAEVMEFQATLGTRD